MRLILAGKIAGAIVTIGILLASTYGVLVKLDLSPVLASDLRTHNRDILPGYIMMLQSEQRDLRVFRRQLTENVDNSPRRAEDIEAATDQIDQIQDHIDRAKAIYFEKK